MESCFQKISATRVNVSMFVFLLELKSPLKRMAVEKDNSGKFKYGNCSESSSSGVCKLSLKGQMVNIISFESLVVSVATIGLTIVA